MLYSNRPLSEWTDKKLAETRERNTAHVPVSMADVIAEQDRREGRRASKWTAITAGAAAVAAIASAIAALIALLRP